MIKIQLSTELLIFKFLLVQLYDNVSSLTSNNNLV
jgi:hypothetical protein